MPHNWGLKSGWHSGNITLKSNYCFFVGLVLPVQAVPWVCDHSHTDLQELQPQLQWHVRPFLQSSNQDRGEDEE